MRTMALLGLAACSGGKTPEVAAPPPEPVAPAVVTPSPAADVVGDLTIRPLYHATVAFTAGDRTWVVDPWVKAPLDGVKADVVLITDLHPDHLDPAAIAAVSKDGTLVVGPPALAEKVHLDVVIANGETKDVAGVAVTGIPMYNLVNGPAPGQLFHDKGRGDGYVFTLGGKKVYVAGDTECTPEMKALTGIDVAFVPMNLPYTMTPDEAAQCIAAFKPAIVYPYHYGASDLSPLAAKVGPGVDVRIRDWYPGGLPF